MAAGRNTVPVPRRRLPELRQLEDALNVFDCAEQFAFDSDTDMEAAIEAASNVLAEEMMLRMRGIKVPRELSAMVSAEWREVGGQRAWEHIKARKEYHERSQ